MTGTILNAFIYIKSCCFYKILLSCYHYYFRSVSILKLRNLQQLAQSHTDKWPSRDSNLKLKNNDFFLGIKIKNGF